jgi:hypothetical protein
MILKTILVRRSLAVQELPLTSTAGNLLEKAQLVADSAKILTATTRLAQ